MDSAAEPPSITRVCVVVSDYGESNSPTKDVDNFMCGPQLHCKDPAYEFTVLSVHKKDVYSKLRQAITATVPVDPANASGSGRVAMRKRFDVFYVLCDGARDEDRAGIEVVEVLEKFGCAFTGARSAWYELTKIEMKVLALRNGIDTARFAVVEADDDARAACARLDYPLIVKHVSGYASVGMSKSNKVKNADELDACVRTFCAEYQSALVEEFVTGTEVTVLVCADSSQPNGVRVYPPVFVTFPEGEDFKHFDLKWVAYEGMQWKQVPQDHPAMAEIQRVARVAFTSMMDGVGYGRADLRIDAATNRVVFLELNPNCGMMYPVGLEASADFILELSGARSDFVKLQIAEALRQQAQQRPAFQVRLDGSRDVGWTTRATRKIAEGDAVLSLVGATAQLAPAGEPVVTQRTTSPTSANPTSAAAAAAAADAVSAAATATSATPPPDARHQLPSSDSGDSTPRSTNAALAPPLRFETGGHATALSQDSAASSAGSSSVAPAGLAAAVVPATATTTPGDFPALFKTRAGPRVRGGGVRDIGLELREPKLYSNIVGGVPFPRATSKERANVALDGERLVYVALRDIRAGEEMLC
jgi:D-alanine-D-alanine ligase-like ATP-grasp enzyme